MEWKLNELSLGQIKFKITVRNLSVYVQPAVAYVEEYEAEKKSRCWKA